MKMHKNLKHLLLTPVALSAFVATNVTASERWFEIEVILMSHLGDKSKIEELYPNSIALPKYRRTFDLLSDYLSPDISLLTQQLPLCGEKEWPINRLNKTLDPVPFFKEKTLTEIDETVLLNIEAEQEGEFILDTVSALEQEASTNDLTQPLALERELTNDSTEKTLDDNNAIEESSYVPLTDEQHQLVIAAESEFVYPTLNIDQENYSNILCQIDNGSLIKNLMPEELALTNDLTPEKMPRVISGAEFEDSKTPYLLSHESLQLTDIVKQIKRSKNFKPLLHLAWRQPVYSERRAIPVKLFAGDNLQQNYLKQKSLFIKEQKLAAEQEQILQHALNLATGSDTNEESNVLSNESLTKEGLDMAKASLINERVNDIANSANQYPENINELLSQADLINTNYINSLPLEAHDSSAPLPPIQPWYLDGLFRVHLKNNYLNITANFNVLNYDSKAQASAALMPGNSLELKTINFDQKRRVISTEIHYFDHPYMGMVVQIRRYKRPTPKVNTGSE